MKSSVLKPLDPTPDLIVPFVESFADYHYIDGRAAKLRKIYGKKLQYTEVAFDSRYWGLFWKHGEKPNKEEIQFLLEESGFRGELS